ncbi:hypothetical protein [Caulobacter segnis]
MNLRSLGLTAILAVSLAACASAPPEKPHGRGGPPGEDGPGPMRGPQLFISPAGEPFRAPPGAPYPVKAWFDGADANHDSTISRDEFVADALRFFAVVDVDKNGVIDGFEVSNYETRIAPEIIGGMAPGSMRRGPMGQGPDGDDDAPRRRPQGTNVLQGASIYGLIAEPEPVMASDGDFDRRITKDEATRAAKTRFALLDTDKDGVLKLEELPKTPAQTGLHPGAKGKGGKGGGMGRGGSGGGRGGGHRRG